MTARKVTVDRDALQAVYQLALTVDDTDPDETAYLGVISRALDRRPA